MSHPPLGLIEGFFGPPWPEADRLAFAPFLQNNDFQFYIYAPKADPYLRKKWREPWPSEFRQKMAALSRRFRAHQVQFGVGLSPFELHKIAKQEGKALLQTKLAQLEEAGIDWLGLFFDDMPLHEGLAHAQLEAIEIVRGATKARVIFCPAFYTPDPILEKVFGKRPEHYWEEIRAAPKEIEFAWTGPKVISEDIPLEHLRETGNLLGRKPFLWDNLFANDGPRNCKFLKLRPPTGRTTAALEASNGWAWNPMNQAHLAQLVLFASLQAAVKHQPPEAALQSSFRALCSRPLAEFLLAHGQEWLTAGLDQLDLQKKKVWIEQLRQWNEPVAREIEQWLAGAYVVGAECLTD